MIIEVDTTFKTIKVKGRVPLKELFDQLNRMFPEFAWEEWTIIEETVVIPDYTPLRPYRPIGPFTNPQPYNPYQQPTTLPWTYPGSGGTITFLKDNGTFQCGNNTYSLEDYGSLSINEFYDVK